MKKINKKTMTPRERQMRRREALKEYLGWGLMMSASVLMILHWIVIGY